MTDITYNGKEVAKMEVHEGDEGYVWFRFRFHDGKTVDTDSFKGEV